MSAKRMPTTECCKSPSHHVVDVVRFYFSQARPGQHCSAVAGGQGRLGTQHTLVTSLSQTEGRYEPAALLPSSSVFLSLLKMKERKRSVHLSGVSVRNTASNRSHPDLSKVGGPGPGQGGQVGQSDRSVIRAGSVIRTGRSAPDEGKSTCRSHCYKHGRRRTSPCRARFHCGRT